MWKYAIHSLTNSLSRLPYFNLPAAVHVGVHKSDNLCDHEQAVSAGVQSFADLSQNASNVISSRTQYQPGRYDLLKFIFSEVNFHMNSISHSWTFRDFL